MMNLNVTPYTEDQREALDLFCEKCGKERIVNNSSYERIKIVDLKGKKGMYWVCYDSGNIVSGAGAQVIRIHGMYFVRALYRAASLISHRGWFTGLNKYHFNSIPFSLILPHCIKWRNINHRSLDIIITANVDFKKHSTSNTDRLFHILQRRGLVSKMREIQLYNVKQSCWKLHTDLYMKKVKYFYEINGISFPFHFIPAEAHRRDQGHEQKAFVRCL